LKKMDLRIEKEKIIIDNSQKLFKQVIRDSDKEMKKDPKRTDLKQASELTQKMEDFVEYALGQVKPSRMQNVLFSRAESTPQIGSFRLDLQADTPSNLKLRL